MSERVETMENVATDDLADVIDRLYRRHHRGVFHLALRYGVGDEAWAEDIAQDVFAALMDNLPRLADHEHLDGWLYRVTTNRCLRRLKRDKFLHRGPVRRFLAAQTDREDVLEGQVFARSDLERTRLALARLPPRERVVVCMCHLDGKSQRKVCETLGLSKGYVSKLLARGVARLQEALDD